MEKKEDERIEAWGLRLVLFGGEGKRFIIEKLRLNGNVSLFMLRAIVER